MSASCAPASGERLGTHDKATTGLALISLLRPALLPKFLASVHLNYVQSASSNVTVAVGAGECVANILLPLDIGGGGLRAP